MTLNGGSTVDRLRQIVGDHGVLTSEEQMAPYLTDWRGRYSGRALAVVFPENTGDVSSVVRRCAETGLAVVPQGGNTGLCGGATPIGEGGTIVINLSRMHRIRWLDPDNNAMLVEAGCTLSNAQSAAVSVDRYFPLSLASEGSCEIGGNLSTNAGGVHVLRYGNMRDLVLGIEVVLPDGRIWDGLRALRKDNTGYDLKQLFIGAEGSLGIITAAVLKLFPAPTNVKTAWVTVPSVDAAVELLGFLRKRCGDRLESFELVSAQALSLVLTHVAGSRLPMDEACASWSVLIELSEPAVGESFVNAFQDAIEAADDEGLITNAVLASSLAQSQALWALRENISEAQRREGFSIKHDIALPISRVPDFLVAAERGIRDGWPCARIVAFGHLGDGNLHFNLSMTEQEANDDFIRNTDSVNRFVHDLVNAFGGSISAEHGIGQLKRGEMLRYKSAVEMDLMRSIKNALDPAGLMNPGKVL